MFGIIDSISATGFGYLEVDLGVIVDHTGYTFVLV